ncbi:hypothetical protein [Streptomyces scabiei]|uniref:hypothetical protein n=1 Tax=Streptomyces scabiei TaxID=1930 RepID=UPI001B3058B1|nr:MULTISPECIES: hypothetical protein [Streptomyces]MBP5870866.1 hypothetical protein [Streptomyces sp. LBUM 1485]MBP5913230.1 hypothetical protein [Streptomyces sp. LBUM 1486]MDX2532299.1 hypothetical protein [Streptomyces scabiei]MDX2794605.1 hypothetical protein [Streptomyces scabiei]MDX3822393.1 hypothetical protein [Streptomyces scabiei]
MDFHTALNSVIADLTPQPWDWSTADGTRLRVIPEGLRQDAGDGVVEIQICEAAHVQVTPTGPEYPMRTVDVPGLITALTDRTEWTTTDWGDVLTVRPEGDGMRLAYTVYDRDTTGRPADVDRTILVPEAQRLPLASALRRALDVAKSWETQ